LNSSAPEPLGITFIGPLLPRLVQVKPPLEDLKGVPVVLAAHDDRTEHRREHVPRDAQPVSPRPVLTRLIHQAFADIEDDSSDHAATLRQHRDQAEARAGTVAHGPNTCRLKTRSTDLTGRQLGHEAWR